MSPVTPGVAVAKKMVSKKMVWGQVVSNVAARLVAIGTSDADTQARRLVEEVSGFEGSEYFGVLAQSPTRQQAARLEAMLARCLAGEPLQYVLGRWSFRGLDLLVNNAVLIPRPETEILAGLVIAELVRRDSPGTLVVDLGTGSGAVGLAVAAECAMAQVVLTDVSVEALTVAQANLAGLGRAAGRVSVYQGSWYEALPNSLAGKVDVVVSNPPYVRDDEVLPLNVADWEPTLALRGGMDGLDAARQILAEATRWLSPRGQVLLELAPSQMLAAAKLATASDLVVEAVHKDLVGRERVLRCSRGTSCVLDKE
ncbi:MAG: peptide chain release factor N(5)-glutamine methyltransferase [Acidimicrobiia bacterium]|nr:peptide chain release factor N(5)-glutamine methyltransferase [Acidimicrobiia bacterium]